MFSNQEPHQSDTTEITKPPSRILLLITSVAYLIALLIYAFWNYVYFNNEIMAKIDKELYIAAVSLKYILPSDFHDRAVDKDSISLEEDKRNALKLTRLVEETGLKYLYSVTKKGDQLYFVASDLTADPKSQRGTYYYYLYEEADKSFYEAFKRSEPTYNVVSDQWGTVRTVMVPETSPGGVKYLACADYDIGFVNTVLKKNLLRSIGSILFFVLLAVPFFLIYRRLRKRHLESLQKSEAKYRTILESMEEGYFEVDLTGTFTLVNNALAKIVGYSKEELLGMNNRDYMDPETAARAYKTHNAALKTGRPQKYVNYEINRKDGQKRTFEVSTTLRLDDKGKPCGFSGIARDITERRKSRELMIQTEKMMSVGGLAAGMAHEINNPLGGMLQGVQNIQRRLSPEFQKNLQIARGTGVDLHRLQSYLEKRDIPSMLDGIKSSGLKAAQIVTNMLQFSRKSESNFAPTDLTVLMERVIDLAGTDYHLKNKYDFKNIEILRDFQPVLPLVPCTQTEIEQVIFNLLINAASAMSVSTTPIVNPQIRLTLEADEKSVSITVADNGPGIDKENLKRIFEPFFTTKPVGEGTGLGLSVSYMIIHNNHDGTIEVESEPGQGTTFVIKLPLQR